VKKKQLKRATSLPLYKRYPRYVWIIIGAYIVFSSFLLSQYLLPLKAELYIKKGYIMNVLKKYSLSIDLIEKAIHYAPLEVQYKNELIKPILSYAEQQPTQKRALSFYNYALEVNTEILKKDKFSPYSHNRHANIYRDLLKLEPEKKDEYSKKIAYYKEKTVKLDRKNPMFLLMYGHFLNRIGRGQEAIEYYTKGLEYDPNLWVGALELSHIYSNMNQEEKALSILLDIDERHDYEQIKLDIANIYIKRKNYPLALDFLNQSLLINPNNISVLAAIGSIHRINKDFEKSLDVYKKLYHVDSDNYDYVKFYVESLLRTNRINEGYSVLKEYSERFPENNVAKRDIDRLTKALRTNKK
jgi:tetratricopeptide (TPR) repeat protein